MLGKRSTTTPTASQAKRLSAITRCVACVINQRNGLPTTGQPAERHHLTLGGLHGQRRLGHDHSIGLCAWHHRGVAPHPHNSRAATRDFGPSYARQPRAFRDHFGRDDALLSLQNELLDWGCA